MKDDIKIAISRISYYKVMGINSKANYKILKVAFEPRNDNSLNNI